MLHINLISQKSFGLSRRIRKTISSLLLVLFGISFLTTQAQVNKSNATPIQIIHTGVNTSLRGLSVVSNNIIWVSGSNGKVGKSITAGETWEWMTVKGFEKSDFRDIEAFDDKTAIIMSIAEPAYILKTQDGGSTWKMVYENKTGGMFLDAMHFSSTKTGIAIGDPIDGHFFIAKTNDAGETWNMLSLIERPEADSGEACFASSGSNIYYSKSGKPLFVSGGKNSRFFNDNKSVKIPILKGRESTGANSIAVSKNERNIFIVGGDFLADTITENNSCFSTDFGKTWQQPNKNLSGYRSSVAFITKNKIIACGFSGVDYSNDGGKNWKKISSLGFHSVQKSKSGKEVYLAGSNGRIGKFNAWK